MGSFSLHAQFISKDIVPEHIQERVENQVDYLAKELALSGKQYTLMKNKLLDFEMKEQKLVNSDLPLKEKNKSIAALDIEKIREVRDILTKTQYDKYVQIVKEQRKNNLENIRN
ncbi:hypothetical protein DNG35_02290 [Mesonia sp. K7]|nr:hypothetical protein DNG35_02290 [Mesonia sp. K7]